MRFKLRPFFWLVFLVFFYTGILNFFGKDIKAFQVSILTLATISIVLVSLLLKYQSNRKTEYLYPINLTAIALSSLWPAYQHSVLGTTLTVIAIVITVIFIFAYSTSKIGDLD